MQSLGTRPRGAVGGSGRTVLSRRRKVGNVRVQAPGTDLSPRRIVQRHFAACQKIPAVDNHADADPELNPLARLIGAVAVRIFDLGIFRNRARSRNQPDEDDGDNSCHCGKIAGVFCVGNRIRITFASMVRNSRRACRTFWKIHDFDRKT